VVNRPVAVHTLERLKKRSFERGEAGRPGDRALDVTRLGEFVEVARFYRLDAESRSQDVRSR
jgi:hypothetical protein